MLKLPELESLKKYIPWMKPDDEIVRGKLRGRLLSWIFYEIHIDSLLNETLVLKSEYVINNENTFPSGTKITEIKKEMRSVTSKWGKKSYPVTFVGFKANSREHVLSESDFSMLIKRCFHTSQTLCFSLQDEDCPDKITKN